MNNTFEIGKKLVDFCKQGKDLEAIETRLPTVKSCKKSFLSYGFMTIRRRWQERDNHRVNNSTMVNYSKCAGTMKPTTAYVCRLLPSILY